MLVDFIKSCKSALKSEIEDYNSFLQEISYNTDIFTVFIPVVIDDFLQIFIIKTTKAKKYNHHYGDIFYIILYGNHYKLDEIIKKWYKYDEISIGK